MINFRQKEFGKAKEVAEFIKKFPTVPLSAGTLGISSANLYVNSKRHKEANEYQKDQLKAMSGLTKALTGVDKTLRNVESKEKDDAKKIIRRKKLFSIESGNYEGTKKTSSIFIKRNNKNK